MLIKIILSRAEMLYAKGKEIICRIENGPGPAVEITTQYQSEKPEIERARLFVSEHGQIKRG